MSMPNERIAYIKKHFSLTNANGEWIAKYANRDGSTWAESRGADRSKVIRDARARWGHFNYMDEAETFDAIFPIGA